MTHGVVIAISGSEGLGVFAVRPFSAREVILTIDDSRVVDDDAPLRAGEEGRHCDYLEAGRVVLMQLPERHINHSWNPNTYVKTMNGERLVIARREIAAGEEITCINGAGDTVCFATSVLRAADVRFIPTSSVCLSSSRWSTYRCSMTGLKGNGQVK